MTSPTTTRPRPVMLVILDGFGWREDRADNAVKLARMPHFNELLADNPHSLLDASGEAVGLPEGQIGNSEVGHLTLGAGRVILQTLPRITKAAQTGELAKNPAITDFIKALKKTGGTCHLMGLASPGGVHAHINHIIALAKVVTDAGVPVTLHPFTDGRDTPPKSAAEYFKTLYSQLPSSVKTGTVSGRYYAMDRDRRWDRVKLAFDAIRFGKGPHFDKPADVVSDAYAHNVTDEFIKPAVINGYTGMKDGDGILSANFRADRIRQLLDAFVFPKFDEFDRGTPVKLASVCGMTYYSDDLAPYMSVAFPKEPLKGLLGEAVADAGLKQLRMAETEKYPHVTYFFNGGEEKEYPGEDRILVASPKVATYDLQPSMSAGELTDKAVKAIDSGKYDLIVLNFANPDMVGHTGRLDAAEKACETVDADLGRIHDAIQKQGGVLLITADHGNCETMKDEKTGEPHTAHTTNQVPVILVGDRKGYRLRSGGSLAGVAPTILELMGLPQPKAMTGKSLLEKK